MKQKLISFSVFFMSLALLQIVYAEPHNLSLLKKEVIAYHDTGLYDKELSKTINKARKFIQQQVLANQHTNQPKKLALVLDIDETSLSNYNKMIRRDFKDNKQLIREEILAGDSPAIPATLSLYNEALKQGVSVFFVTGRGENARKATIKNLTNTGYTNWSGLYLRPDGYNLPSIAPFKSQARAAISKQGYTIVASIGDQHSDIHGGYMLKGFKLPNPYYYLP